MGVNPALFAYEWELLLKGAIPRLRDKRGEVSRNNCFTSLGFSKDQIDQWDDI